MSNQLIASKHGRADPRTAVIARQSTTAALAAILAATLSACVYMPEPDPDDEGHASFAHAVIPALLGRKPYGVDEVEVVADIAELYGRETAVAMLMKDTRFVDHWADVLVEQLRIQRERTGGIAVAQDAACWGEPTREAPDPAIAAWVRDHAPGDPGTPTPAWNMSDLAHSAIALDDLSVLYRANLFTMSMRRAGGGTNSKRAEITQHLLEAYVNRDISCLRCHNPTYSASNKTDGGGSIVWRRTWTIPGHPEKALFGNYYDATAATSRILPIMRGDVRQAVGGGMGIQPWGMDASCVTDTVSRNPTNAGTVTHTGFQAAGAQSNPTAGFGSLDGGVNPQVSLWELEAALNQGILDLQDGYERIPATAPLLPPDEQQFCDVVEIFAANCTGCHSGGAPSANMDLAASDLDPVLINAPTQGPSSTNAARVVPGDPATSELSRRVNGGANPWVMPPGGGLAAADITTVDAWITAGATVIDTANCTTSTVPDVDPDEAFAYLTAANLVDGLWMASMGHPLTVDNHYARNKAQRDALWNLTEYTFLPNDWSLKAVLQKVLASDWIGRRAPTISQAGTAYELPLVLDPWVQADPSEVSNPSAHARANGQGEMVDLHRVNTVLRNIAGALAWQEPRRFPGGGYPSPLDQDLGQYLSPGLPGFSGVNFQSLLALEDEVGLCGKGGHAVGSEDWIDLLVTEVTAFNAANPHAPLTIGEVWSTLKDRMIQDPTIEQALPVDLVGDADAKTEEQAVAALFNAGLGTDHGLNTPATALAAGDLGGKLREACGVLVKTPEFLLTNVTPRGYSDNNMPDPPRLTVCMDGEPCGYAATCNKWRVVLNGMGKFTACEDRSVRRSPLVILPLPRDFVFELVNARFELLCPPKICGFVARPRVDPCLRDPRACEVMDPIPPLPPVTGVYTSIGRPPVDLHDPGILAMMADGALVTKTQGVRHRPVGMRKWQTLETGTRLRTGDQLHVPLTATLYLKDGAMAFGVDALEHEAIEGISAQLISVTGDDAVEIIDRHFTKPGTMSLSELTKAIESGSIESRAMTDEDWGRAIGYGAKPHSRPTPTLDEIAEINADFAALHAGLEDAGPDQEPPYDDPGDSQPPSDNAPDDKDGAGLGAKSIVLLWILLIAAVIVGLVVRRLRR